MKKTNKILQHNILYTCIKIINNNTLKQSINNIQIRYITDNNNAKDLLKQEKKQLYEQYESIKCDISKKEQALKGELGQFVYEADKSMSNLTNNEKSLVKTEIKDILDTNKEFTKEYKQLDIDCKTFYTKSTSSRSSFESIDCNIERKILDVKAEQGEASITAKNAILKIFTDSKNPSDFTKQGLSTMGDSIEKHAKALNQSLEDQDELLLEYDYTNIDYKAIKISQEKTLDVTEQTTRSRSSSVDTVIPVSELPEAVNKGKGLNREQESLPNPNHTDSYHNTKDSDSSDNKESNIKENLSNINEQTNKSKEITGLTAINTITDVISNIDLSNTGLF